MYQSKSSASAGHRHPSSTAQEPPFRCPPYQQRHWRSQFPSYNYDRPPGNAPAQPNFIVQLRPEHQRAVKQAVAEAVVWKLKFHPQGSNFIVSNSISASLAYEQWSETLATMVQMWGMKMDEGLLVGKWMKKLATVQDKIKRISSVLCHRASLRVFNELCEKNEVLVGESTIISTALRNSELALGLLKSIWRMGKRRNAISKFYHLYVERLNGEGFIC